MMLFKRRTLYILCALLALGFATVEDLAGAAGLGTFWGGDDTGASLVGIPELRAAEFGSTGEPVLDQTEYDEHSSWSGPVGIKSPITDASTDSEVLHRICRVTAYNDRGLTAAGVPSGVGQCAAPADIPFGTLVYIPALDQTFVVTDRTHRRFRNSTVDLFIPSKQSCRQFGRHFLECVFILPDQPVAYGEVQVP
jgi:3D (Asp-Asp-Asp) domain-containing protein